MKAQVLMQAGGPEQFELQQRPMPKPGKGQVLVRVHAASVNPADIKTRRNGPPTLPAILGADFAGTVAALGEGVSDYAIGDEVYGCAGGFAGIDGSYAEYMVADVRLMAPKPSALDFRQAAALPLVGITAYEGLFDRVRVKRGDKVLVFGAVGGVGHVALQLAKAAGAIVTAVVSTPEKAALARKLGADHIVNYREESVSDYVQRLTDGVGFDVVFDAIGSDNLNIAIEAARPQGQVITLVARQSYDLGPAFSKGLSIHIVFMLIPMLHNLGRERHSEILRELNGLVAQGKLQPLLDQKRFQLAELSEAHSYLEQGRAVGKVVIDIGG
ncbi:zinc-dependent alcohol dehydrogenase family protein [Permianibacter aggregans]|uniref:NADPH2:quinone reductase n=1 Tax=Permianibacter aggregans TaxID=1510150 RepID=A0A4R6UQJ1_9GAMM|nr:zinc-dependent alcohol dehydrogenase family protein [Permianibacter aggregans]QGX40549.1 quinone oxidoreductase [Permianibacter aggregans]TDQ49301.1 NADPH2:quinone reductase [Permianibacter aggregans]